MAEEAVGGDVIFVKRDARQVIGIGGADSGFDGDDLCFGEAGGEGVEGAEEFHGATKGYGFVVGGFDVCGADHENVVFTWDDVEWVAWMHEADGAGEGEFRVVDDEGFAFYAA